MKIARIISFLLIACMARNVQSMQPVYHAYVPLEERVLNNDLTIEQYVSAWENLPRYGKMVKQLRNAYYANISNLYDEFLEDVSMAVASAQMYGNAQDPMVRRGLYNTVKGSAVRLYGQLSDAVTRGYAILGNGA